MMMMNDEWCLINIVHLLFYFQMKGFNGILALMLGSGIGLLRVFMYKPNLTVDIVPADRTIDAMTTLAWYQTTLHGQQKDKNVYNYVSCNDNKVTLKRMTDQVAHVFDTAEESCDKMLWRRSTIVTHNITIYNILMYILHCIPAVVFTIAEKLTGRKPVIMKTYRKIFFLKKTMAYFYLNEWLFENDNTRAMVAAVTDEDRKWCDSSMSNFRWEPMFSSIPRLLAKYMVNSPLTKEYYQSKGIYMFRADYYLRFMFKAVVVYGFLSIIAFLVNSFC